MEATSEEAYRWYVMTNLAGHSTDMAVADAIISHGSSAVGCGPIRWIALSPVQHELGGEGDNPQQALEEGPVGAHRLPRLSEDQRQVQLAQPTAQMIVHTPTGG